MKGIVVLLVFILTVHITVKSQLLGFAFKGKIDIDDRANLFSRSKLVSGDTMSGRIYFDMSSTIVQSTDSSRRCKITGLNKAKFNVRNLQISDKDDSSIESYIYNGTSGRKIRSDIFILRESDLIFWDESKYDLYASKYEFNFTDKTGLSWDGVGMPAALWEKQFEDKLLMIFGEVKDKYDLPLSFSFKVQIFEIGIPEVLTGSVQDCEAGNFRVFPNPSATGRFYLELGTGSLACIEISDAYGKIRYIDFITPVEQNNELNLTILEKGIYNIHVIQNGKGFQKKLFIE